MKLLAGILAVLGLLATAFVFLTTVFVDNRVSEELLGRLRQLPYALVRLAARRLPAEVREDHAREWTAELSMILEDEDAGDLPITRLCGGIRYALGLLRTAHAIGRHLTPPTPAAGAAHSTNSLGRAVTAAAVTAVFFAEVTVELFRVIHRLDPTDSYGQIVVTGGLGSGDVDVSGLPATVGEIAATVGEIAVGVLALLTGSLAIAGFIVVVGIIVIAHRMKLER